MSEQISVCSFRDSTDFLNNKAIPYFSSFTFKDIDFNFVEYPEELKPFIFEILDIFKQIPKRNYTGRGGFQRWLKDTQRLLQTLGNFYFTLGKLKGEELSAKKELSRSSTLLGKAISEILDFAEIFLEKKIRIFENKTIPYTDISYIRNVLIDIILIIAHLCYFWEEIIQGQREATGIYSKIGNAIYTTRVLVR